MRRDRGAFSWSSIKGEERDHAIGMRGAIGSQREKRKKPPQLVPAPKTRRENPKIKHPWATAPRILPKKVEWKPTNFGEKKGRKKKPKPC